MTKRSSSLVKRYLIKLRDQIFVKSYGFLYFAKNVAKNIGKNVTGK